MPEALHNSPATSPQRMFVAVFVLLIVLVALGTIPYADMAMPVIVPFLPIFAATVVLTEALTAYLLIVQFMATRHLYLVPMAGAYAYVVAMVSVQLLVFPGVFAPAGLLGGNSQSAIWLWVFWHGGFPALICVSVLLREWRHPLVAQRRVSPWQGVSLFLLAPLLALVLAYVAVRVESLPVLITGNSFMTLSSSAAGWAVWALNLAAVVLVLLPKKSGELANLFLFVAVLASLADVSLTLLSAARYSLGWYVSRLLSIVSSVSLLTALIFQITRLYQDLVATHASLLRTSARDNLTGVYNRNSFDVAAKAEWQRAQRSGEPLSVVLVDIDHFKRYNDHFGHVQGDACLHAVAQALAGSVQRPTDMVARYGGEEFVIMLPGTRTEYALRIAEKARLAVSALQRPTHPPGQQVSISAGCASWDTASAFKRFEEVLVAADKALYKAKEQGRNQVWAVQDLVLRPVGANTGLFSPQSQTPG